MLDRFWMWLAWKLPKRLVYWATIRCGAYATTGEHSDTDVPAMPFMSVLKRWKS